MDFIPNSLGQISELTQGLQIGTTPQFNLNDDTFANLLNSKLDGIAGDGLEVYTQLMGPLGVPAGLNIEGLTDPFKVSAVDAGSMSELSLNQSEANGEDENILKAAGNKLENLFDNISGKTGGNINVTDLFSMKTSPSRVNLASAQEKLASGFGQFMQKHAASLYGTMGKTIAHNIGDILSAM